MLSLKTEVQADCSNLFKVRHLESGAMRIHTQVAWPQYPAAWPPPYPKISHDFPSTCDSGNGTGCVMSVGGPCLEEKWERTRVSFISETQCSGMREWSPGWATGGLGSDWEASGQFSKILAQKKVKSLGV